MPAELRADVVTYVQRNTIAQIPWFDGKEATFVADIVVLLKPRLFKASVGCITDFFSWNQVLSSPLLLL